MRRPHRSTLLALLAVLTVGSAACGSGGGNGAAPTPQATSAHRIASTAKLAIVEPEPGATVDANDVDVRLDLKGATVVQEVSLNLQPDKGHIHLVLDGRTLTLLGSLHESLNDLVEGPLEPGPHLLEAEFVASDHGPFDPRVISTVSFTAR